MFEYDEGEYESEYFKKNNDEGVLIGFEFLYLVYFLFKAQTQITHLECH